MGSAETGWGLAVTEGPGAGHSPGRGEEIPMTTIVSHPKLDRVVFILFKD